MQRFTRPAIALAAAIALAVGLPTPAAWADGAVAIADAPAAIAHLQNLQIADATAAVATDAVATDAETDADASAEAILINAPRIRDLQGAGHRSPQEGEFVRGVRGLATAVDRRGFFLQDPEPDADAATSEGIYVFTRNEPDVAVGDEVEVSGLVVEYVPGRRDRPNANLPLTEIDATKTGGSIVVLSADNPLPEPVRLGRGGRVPPDRVIEDDGFSRFDPDTDGLDFYESLEGMRVRIDDAIALDAPDRGILPVLPDGGRGASGRSDAGGLVIQADDFNPERLFLSNDLAREQPSALPGDRFDGAIVGVLDYENGLYVLKNTAPLPPLVARNAEPERTALVGTDDRLTVAAFNVENLSPRDRGRLSALGRAIVENLRSPDLLALTEIQDNNGDEDNATTDASETYRALIDAIRDAGGPAYDFRDIAPERGRDGGKPGSNIRPGFLFRPDRLQWVDRPAGRPDEAVAAVRDGAGAALSVNPGRIAPDDPAFERSRKPLVGEFRFNGQRIFAIAVHFNSRRGDDPLFGRNQPPQLDSETQRLAQARAVRGFLDDLLAIDPEAKVLVMGDLNDFEFSPVLAAVAGDDLANAIDRLPLGDRFTYIYQGNGQVLDHVLVGRRWLETADLEVEIPHFNLTVPNGPSDHEPAIVRLKVPAGSEAGSPPPNASGLGASEPNASEPNASEPNASEPNASEPGALEPDASGSAALPESPIAPDATSPESPPDEAPAPIAAILPDLEGQALLDRLAADYKPRKSLSYGQARDLLYGTIDNDDGTLSGAYTGYTIPLGRGGSPRRDAYRKGINAEHVLPQSKGASGPAKSDLHNLFPARISVNSARGNLPFGESPDRQTRTWYRDDGQRSEIPDAAIDEYSELGRGQFEPREAVKGDAARAVFYAYTLYRDRVDGSDRRFFPSQRAVLCEWHRLDPPDDRERQRSDRVRASPQGNANPFVLDPGLAGRTYCP